jgi:siroheme synthase-like protein
MGHKYMPISVNLKDRPCLVVGGGTIALRKVEALMDYDTKITVVAPKVHELLENHAKEGRITMEKREYRPPEAAAYTIVISASDNNKLNKQVYEDAKGSGALVNVVDDPPHCDFIFPAVLRRDCLTTAISTDGKAPFMSGHLRLLLEDLFPKHWERLMALAADFRGQVRERWGGDHEKMTACYTKFLGVDWKTMLEENNNAGVQEELDKILDGSE